MWMSYKLKTDISVALISYDSADSSPKSDTVSILRLLLQINSY